MVDGAKICLLNGINECWYDPIILESYANICYMKHLGGGALVRAGGRALALRGMMQGKGDRCRSQEDKQVLRIKKERNYE